jgi:hypothetical protein
MGMSTSAARAPLPDTAVIVRVAGTAAEADPAAKARTAAAAGSAGNRRSAAIIKSAEESAARFREIQWQSALIQALDFK